MAGFPCPFCGHALVASADAPLDRCPRCDGGLQIAYRYHLVEAHGELGGARLYRAIDDGFGESVAVVFVADPDDHAEVERFVEGHRLFADLGGVGLVKILEVGSARDPRPYVVMDWLADGTLDKRVAARGPLDQAALLELVGDLLTGMSKAHRSMPAIVHGHIHPGKIGFRAGDDAVLLGFEHARQVNAQASRLAYSFTGDQSQRDHDGLAHDLRALGVSFYYAATGEWLGDRPVADQRARVRAEIPGPLGRLLDRLLGAGADGYVSAVEAAIDFDALRRGVDDWQGPRTLASTQQDGPMGTAWGGQASAIAGVDLDGDGEPDWDDDDDDRDQADGPSWAEPEPSAARQRAAAPDYAAWATSEAAARARTAAMTRAHAEAEAKAGKSGAGRLLFVVVGMLVMAGTCVAGIIEDAANEMRAPEPAPPVPIESNTYQPPEPIPLPVVEPEPELAPEPEPALGLDEPPPSTAGLPGTFAYTATVVGPAELRGLELGDTCEVWISPADAGALNCRWAIDCGSPRRRIYGGGDAGYSSCRFDREGRPLGATDEDDDAADGAFFADLEGSEPMLLVLDRWLLPPVNVMLSVAVDSGGLTTEPVPATAQAARTDPAEITRRIAADDYPTLATDD